MSEENNDNTANLETVTPSEDTPEVSEQPEVTSNDRPSIDNYKDEYDKRVDALLARYEAGFPSSNRCFNGAGSSTTKSFTRTCTET